jgi:hypothetical protein
MTFRNSRATVEQSVNKPVVTQLKTTTFQIRNSLNNFSQLNASHAI